MKRSSKVILLLAVLLFIALSMISISRMNAFYREQAKGVISTQQEGNL